jgi:hypothetical protein
MRKKNKRVTHNSVTATTFVIPQTLSKIANSTAVTESQQRPMTVYLNSGRNVPAQEIENTQKRRVKPFFFFCKFPMTSSRTNEQRVLIDVTRLH